MRRCKEGDFRQALGRNRVAVLICGGLIERPLSTQAVFALRLVRAAFYRADLRNVLLIQIVRTRQPTGVRRSVDGSQITPQCFGVWAGGRFGIHILVFLDHRAVEGQSRIGT